MTSRHRITEALNETSMADCEKVFHHLCTGLIEKNSGINDFKIVSSDCYNNNAPFKADQFTRFRITDTSMDIVDISKGFITMTVNVDVQFLYDNLQATQESTTGMESTVFFIGFKSASHIINVYNVYSNGRLKACKQTKAKHEQAIVYMSKAKEEKIARPGMYSPHEKVLEMSDCVAGAYIKLPPFNDRNTKQVVTMDLVMQIDDLTCLNAFSYYPRFLTGELELEVSMNLINNMVWCQIPLSTAIENTDPDSSSTLVHYNSYMDTRFHQCGDYATCYIPYRKDIEPDGFKKTSLTIVPSNLTVETARSHVYGFNIKDTSKQNIAKEFSENGFVMPAQHIEHYTFSQLPNQTDIKTNLQVSLWNCAQVVMTFPNSPNQLTVSRNPHLEAVQCHIADRIIPDKFFKTTDRAHAEMVLSALGMDSLFSAADELIEALTKNRGKVGTWTLTKKDDSDYMLVLDLERAGSGCFCDGLSGQSIPINFQANYMYNVENPHYYHIVNGVKELRRQNINVFFISDAFWVFSPNGGEYIKDGNSVY